LIAQHQLLTITQGLTELPCLIDAVDAFCEAVALSQHDAHSLHLAIEEIVSNVLQHGYCGVPHPVTISLEALPPNRVRTVVSDHAHAFNPLSRPEVDTTLPLEQRPIGGLGVHLVKRLMDFTHYERRDGQNILTMELFCSTPPAEAA
jgi:anti-sigma regulatory factor (Ser/Thr protein kinase)